MVRRNGFTAGFKYNGPTMFEANQPAQTLPQKRSLWRNRDFLKLWSGKTISAFGSEISGTAISLAAILTLNATPMQLGLLGALAGIPALIIGLPAGVWVDRMRRKPIMIASDLLRAAALVTIPAAAVFGILSFVQLVLVSMVVKALTVFFEVADNSFLPAVTSRDQLVEGNSKLGISDSLAEIGGPAIGGVLVQAITAPFAILVDSGSYIVSALLLARIRTPEPLSQGDGQTPSMTSEIVEGMRTVRSSQVLLALLAATAVFNLLGSFFGALYSLYVIRSLGLTPVLLGVVISAGGVGALIGAASADRVTRRIGVGPALISGMAVHAVTALLTPLAFGSVPQVTAILLFAQIAGDTMLMIFFINAVSLRQAVTPDRLLGRVNASFQVIVAVVGPIGFLLGGLLGERLGLRPTLFIAATGSWIATAILLASPVRTIRVLPVVDSVTE
ncbi:MAG: MFS transporter [Anaerolineae bacterium]|nr:MFS transporter [Anaerolineae bacterium]MCB0248795.1 MFS transporter [Anaerolineae bacterium]